MSKRFTKLKKIQNGSKIDKRLKATAKRLALFKGTGERGQWPALPEVGLTFHLFSNEIKYKKERKTGTLSV